MHYPFLVIDPRSGLQYRLTDTGLAELSLAPISAEWAPGRAIAETPDISGGAKFGHGSGGIVPLRAA